MPSAPWQAPPVGPPELVPSRSRLAVKKLESELGVAIPAKALLRLAVTGRPKSESSTHPDSDSDSEAVVGLGKSAKARAC